MTKIDDRKVEWRLNFVNQNHATVSVNAMVALEHRDIIKDALRQDKFASELFKSELPNRWHVGDNVLWYDLNRLYLSESLRIKAKTLSHDNPLAGH